MIKKNFRNQLGQFNLEDLTKYVLNGTKNVNKVKNSILNFKYKNNYY